MEQFIPYIDEIHSTMNDFQVKYNDYSEMNKRVQHIEIENKELKSILNANNESIKTMVSSMQVNMETMNKNILNLEKKLNK